MTYHRFGDPVITPDGPAIFQGYWPDKQLAKVKMVGGWYRSFHKSNITPLAQACHDILVAEAGFEGVEEIRT